MDLCSIDLNNYLLNRDKPLSINEVKEILFQLNNILKKLNEVNKYNKYCIFKYFNRLK